MNAYIVLIAISSVIILSYLIGVFSRFTRIPSVLILLVLGACGALLLKSNGIVLPDLNGYVRLLGTIGLIFIVLEASIDLKISKDKRFFIAKAAFSALAIILLSAAGIAGVFRLFFSAPWQTCIVNAIPLSIISSAITIPSISRLDPTRREFLTYESTFSDIFGVLLFNFASNDGPITVVSGGLFLAETLGLVVASIVVVILLVMLLRKKDTEAKFFLIIAALILVYCLGKIVHLSTLILVLIFGLALGNLPSTLPGKLGKFLKPEALVGEVPIIHRFVKELAFFIRTFFFLAFGLSIRLESLFTVETQALGGAIIAIILVVRFVFLRLLAVGASATEVLVSPRGLVTVLLVYGIPSEMRIGGPYDDIVYTVILISGIVMTIGLLLEKKLPISEVVEDS